MTNFSNDSLTAVYSETNSVATMRTVCQVWISLPVAVCGIVGNILSILVFKRYKQAKPTTMLLKAIAVMETCSLVLGLLLRSLREFENDFLDSIVSYVFPVLYPLTYFFKTANTWLTVLLTVERCIAACKPFKARQICTFKRTKIAIFLILLFVTFFTTPRFKEYKSVSFSKNPSGFEETALMSDYVYTLVYRIFIFLLVAYIIPIILLIFLNIKIIIALRWASKQHTSFFLFHTPIPSTKHISFCEMTQSFTIIAVIVVTVFIVCNSVVMVAYVLYSVEVAFENLKGSIELHRRIVTNVSNVLSTISCSINFVIYCLFSRRFRLVLGNVLTCKTCDRPGKKAIKIPFSELSSRKSLTSTKKTDAPHKDSPP